VVEGGLDQLRRLAVLLDLQRELDHFSEDYDPEVTARTLALLERDEHHFILAYHQQYDDTLHRTTPLGSEALAAARRHVDAFAELADAAREHWRDRSYALAFTPDHGAHVDEETGRGTHGSDMPDDLDVWHYWGMGAPATS